MSFTRENPSPRYKTLVAMYREMHAEGEKFLGIPAEKTFPGQSLPPHALAIKALISRLGARTLLDYGSGKGKQYQPMQIADADGKTFASIPELWNTQVTCYDPAYTPFSELPKGKFDAVVSTDVLEHVPEEDAEWVVDEIFSYANKFVYTNVACYAAAKRLPNGENAHATIRPIEWWKEVFARASKKHGDIPWLLQVEEKKKRYGFFGKERLVTREVGPLA